jgi:Holliday junction resolvasome RuvABC endonuclease subunit
MLQQTSGSQKSEVDVGHVARQRAQQQLVINALLRAARHTGDDSLLDAVCVAATHTHTVYSNLIVWFRF